MAADRRSGQERQGGSDDKYYRLGDEVAAVISGTLPTGLGRVPEIAWTDDFANVDSILDLKDTSSIKVYEQDTTDEPTPASTT